jgi:seryl-tRNA synthetase
MIGEKDLFEGEMTMLDMKFLRDNLDLVRRKMLERGKEIDLDLFVSLDRKRRDILQEVESLRGERNKVSKEIGARKKK